ncbi:LPXTG cell wall anchor domain-containing protein [Oceanobacillus polygoni]|uniref:LPXTG-motif cell wall-anchored protein n=1 Tax=Oceanobacillus polygoni TaxID=1235259 RepID=A0A9X0YQ96_9BACI|nr:LPXTG cell wall anchor domain-containing protein [Oceanobacillus polygoni]MBP2076817.1 LPXTG-motif cell wall-anchored protein [Oceanobacillus polygoni]
MGGNGMNIGSWVAIGVAVAVALGLFGKQKKKK